MTRPINRLTLTAALTAMAVSLAAPMAFAQGKSSVPAGCVMLQNGQSQCNQQPQAKGVKAAPQPVCKAQPQVGAHPQAKAQPQVKSRKSAAHSPAVGETARRAPVLQQARNSRLPKPPAHQHYRVIGDTVVRVDDSTLAVVAIVGAARPLLAP